MVIVFNPTAGGRRHRHLLAALDALRARAIDVVVLETRRAGDATGLARDAAARGESVVVAAGGDGTIAEVAEGIAGSATRLGILPLGTANVLARELDLPLRMEAAAAVLATGGTARLHPGLARFADGRRRLFVQMLGAGFDAAVVQALDLGLKRRIGRGAYVWQTLRALPRYGFADCSVTIDDEVLRARGVIVTKGRLYAGHYLLAPEARWDAPGFQVALLQDVGRFGTLLAGIALPLNLLPRLPGLILRPARRVALDGATLPVQMDGDPAGCLPVEVVDASAPIAVIVPSGVRFTDHAGPKDAPACPIPIP